MSSWIDGRLEKDAKVSLLSHSLHYGSGIFDGMRFFHGQKGPAIFRGDDHIERFFHSAKAIGQSLSFTPQEIKKGIKDVIRESGLLEGYIRPFGFFGDGDMELNPTVASFHVGIAVWPWPARLGDDPISVTLSSFTRTPEKSTILTAKISGHYGNSILARQEARRKGFSEALLLDQNGNIAEGSGANFFCVKNGKLYTPFEKNIFPGITRDTVIQLAKDVKIDVILSDIPFSEIPSFDEAFFTGTAVGIVPIANIDHFYFKESNGSVTKKLKDLRTLAVEGKMIKYEHWLSYL
jgi:branched-chain amino acid aminotransferase